MRVFAPARTILATAVAALAAGSLILAAGAASAAPAGAKPKSEATFLHLNAKVVAHAKHHTDSISGVLTADRKGVAAETVTLFTWSRKHHSFVSTGLTATTGADGTFSFTITAPTRTSHYEAKFAGDKAASPALRDSHSNTITITVKPHKK